MGTPRSRALSDTIWHPIAPSLVVPSLPLHTSSLPRMPLRSATHRDAATQTNPRYLAPRGADADSPTPSSSAPRVARHRRFASIRVPPRVVAALAPCASRADLLPFRRAAALARACDTAEDARRAMRREASRLREAWRVARRVAEWRAEARPVLVVLAAAHDANHRARMTLDAQAERRRDAMRDVARALAASARREADAADAFGAEARRFARLADLSEDATRMKQKHPGEDDDDDVVSPPVSSGRHHRRLPPPPSRLRRRLREGSGPAAASSLVAAVAERRERLAAIERRLAERIDELAAEEECGAPDARGKARSPVLFETRARAPPRDDDDDDDDDPDISLSPPSPRGEEEAETFPSAGGIGIGIGIGIGRSAASFSAGEGDPSCTSSRRRKRRRGGSDRDDDDPRGVLRLMRADHRRPRAADHHQPRADERRFPRQGRGTLSLPTSLERESPEARDAAAPPRVALAPVGGEGEGEGGGGGDDAFPPTRGSPAVPSRAWDGPAQPLLLECYSQPEPEVTRSSSEDAAAEAGEGEGEGAFIAARRAAGRARVGGRFVNPARAVVSASGASGYAERREIERLEFAETQSQPSGREGQVEGGAGGGGV